ncbi:MAG TPA: hypothetical protein VGL59_04675, partial [Polyangia bacterium]
MPVGAWSEYRSITGDLRFRIVIAVVAREHGTQAIETTVQDESVPNAPIVVTRNVLGINAVVGDKSIAGAVQVDDNIPMTLPPEEKPSPNTL